MFDKSEAVEHAVMPQLFFKCEKKILCIVWVYLLILSSRSLDKVLPETLEHFREPAQDLIEERGAEDALAAAMAVISGATKIKSRSILSNREVSQC